MIYLHIGRGKSGSSSIQTLLRDHQDRLAAEGFNCPLSGKDANHASIARRLRSHEKDAATEFSSLLMGNRVIISSEFFLQSDEIAIQAIKSVVAGREIKIIVYLRDYPNWLVSAYAQQAKRGISPETFNAFVERQTWKISALQYIARWADAFGWERLHIRTLARSDLDGGELISDFWAALDLTSTPPVAARQNVSPPWYVLEFLRSVVGRLPRGTTIEKSDVRRLTNAIKDTFSNQNLSPAQFMSEEKWRISAILFNSDISEISARTGKQLTPINDSISERHDPPSLSTIEPNLITSLDHRVRELKIGKATKRSAIKTIRKLLATRV